MPKGNTVLKGSLLQRKTVFFFCLCCSGYQQTAAIKARPPVCRERWRDGGHIQELEARVATLESQKGALQSKLSLAKQHILDLGARTHYRPRIGEGYDKW